MWRRDRTDNGWRFWAGVRGRSRRKPGMGGSAGQRSSSSVGCTWWRTTVVFWFCLRVGFATSPRGCWRSPFAACLATWRRCSGIRCCWPRPLWTRPGSRALAIWRQTGRRLVRPRASPGRAAVGSSMGSRRRCWCTRWYGARGRHSAGLTNRRRGAGRARAAGGAVGGAAT